MVQVLLQERSAGLKDGGTGYVPLLSIKQYRSTRGFTLIELMIAVAFVAVLISLTVPLYSGYKIRAKVTECIDEATVARFAITEYHQTYGEWPPDLESTGAVNSGSSQYCNTISSYERALGSFIIDINEPAIAFELVNISPKLIPTVTLGNVINWDCTVGETEFDEIIYLPANCRND